MGQQVTESFRVPDEFLNRTLVESQPTRSVPRQVCLASDRNIAAVSPNLTPQPRQQRRHQCVGRVEAARPLRGIALFDGKCDLTDTATQEATVHSCHSSNPGIIIICLPRTAARSHFAFCMALCTWQQGRGALYILRRFPRNSPWRSTTCARVKGARGLDGTSERWVPLHGWTSPCLP